MLFADYDVVGAGADVARPPQLVVADHQVTQAVDRTVGGPGAAPDMDVHAGKDKVGRAGQGYRSELGLQGVYVGCVDCDVRSVVPDVNLVQGNV